MKEKKNRRRGNTESYTSVSKRQNIGLPPGTLVDGTAEREHYVAINSFLFSSNSYSEQEVSRDDLIRHLTDHPEHPWTDMLSSQSGTSEVAWVNIIGLHDKNLLEALGFHLKIHPLVLEDIQNVGHRPKIEDYGSYVMIIFKMLHWNQDSRSLHTEQVSLILGRDYVITFQEHEGDVFDSIRERIRSGTGRVRKSGADYLAYALIDTIIDNYFFIIENIEEEVENIEYQIIEEAHGGGTPMVYQLKKQLVILRKAIWPLREMLYESLREEYSLIGADTKLFLKDAFDHIVQVIDSNEVLRDILKSAEESYHAQMSNSTNAVMKVLTIIATIFMPLTFIAGIYGMNFHFIPELQWKWGYFAVLGIMVIVAGSMIVFFRRRNWL